MVFAKARKKTPKPGNTEPVPFPAPQEIPPDFVRAGDATLPPKSAVESTPAPAPKDALTAEEARRIKQPYWCWVEAQRMLHAVDEGGLYGTPEGADMIAAAHVWATLSLPQVDAHQGTPHA